MENIHCNIFFFTFTHSISLHFSLFLLLLPNCTDRWVLSTCCFLFCLEWCLLAVLGTMLVRPGPSLGIAIRLWMLFLEFVFEHFSGNDTNYLVYSRYPSSRWIRTVCTKKDIVEVKINLWMVYQTENYLWIYHIDGLVQERCNSIANTLELCLSCTNTSTWFNQQVSM